MPDGVAVTLVAEEGLQYSWDKALWTDNTIFTVQQLDTAMSMKAGEVASSTKIDKGVHEIEEAYGKQGYINVYLRAVPEFDDANKRVTYRFNVKEGQQYLMGIHKVTGLPEELAKRVTNKWKLAPGAIYDASYDREFFRSLGPNDRELAIALSKFPKTEIEAKPDKDKLTVDVTINFK